MGAGVTYNVEVIVSSLSTVEVYAVTSDEAIENAKDLGYQTTGRIVDDEQEND